MDISVAKTISMVIAIALPILALLDFLATPFKCLFFAVTLNGKALKNELVNTIKHLALIFFSVPASCVHLAKPGTVYHDKSSWKSIKIQKFIENVENHKSKVSGNKRYQIKQAIETALPSIITSGKATRRLKQIVDCLVDQIKDDSDRVSSHTIQWLATCLIECQDSKLPLETIDKTFFDLMGSLTKLRLPVTRLNLTKQIISNYSHNKKTTLNFQRKLDAIKNEKETQIEKYLSDLKNKQVNQIKNTEERIKRTIEAQKKAEKEATVYETLHETLSNYNFDKTLREEIHASLYPPKKKIITTSEVDALCLKIRQHHNSTIQTDKKQALLEKALKIAVQKRKKANGIVKGVEKQKDTLSKLKNQPQKTEISDKDLEKRFPVFDNSYNSFLLLYVGLSYIDEKEIDNLFTFVKKPRFKDSQYANKLVKLFLQMKKTDKNTTQHLMSILFELSKKDNKKLEITLIAVKNASMLLKLKKINFLKSSLKDPSQLTSKMLIAQLFSNTFNLPEYKNPIDIEKLSVKYEQTFGRFRDPAAIMTYYATLSTLPKKKRQNALNFLTRYVSYVLDESLHRKRHDPSLCPHLAYMYKRFPDIQDQWEKSEMQKVGNFQPKLSTHKLKNYIIGETEDPCGLLMLSTEISKSCMHISGRASKARGLLGHILDGKIHPVVIKNEQGKIVARMLMRLLEDKKTKLPILVLDHLYTITTKYEIKDQFNDLIINYCKSKADKMKLKLVSFEKKRKRYSPVISHGGPGADEHVNPFDNMRDNKKYPDGMTDGNYTVKKIYSVD